MHIAIAITLFFAAATSALGIPRALARYRALKSGLGAAAPVAIAIAMTAWFGAA